MDIKLAGSQPSGTGPAEYFTGIVRIDELSKAKDCHARPLPTSRSSPVPGRHTHPLGQTLIVTSGCGWVQSEGGPKAEIRPGAAKPSLTSEEKW